MNLRVRSVHEVDDMMKRRFPCRIACAAPLKEGGAA